MTAMKLSASSKCVKYLMFIFNLLFVITGIILLSIGATIHAVYYKYNHFLDNKFLSVPSLLIAVGVIIFFIAFFGCCGAVRENYCMLITFTTLLVCIFVLELSAGISGYALRSQAGDIIKEKMIDTIPKYKKNEEIARFWDLLQNDFKCCGVDNSTDWSGVFKTGDLPQSCCQLETNKFIPVMDTTVCNTTSLNIHPRGCLDEFQYSIKSHAIQLGGVGLGIAFIQGVGIWFSIYLARSIRNSYETV